MLEQESVRSPALVEEGVGETACDELTTAPHPSPCATEEVEEFGVKSVSRKLFSDVALFIIILHCLIGNKVN